MIQKFGKAVMDILEIRGSFFEDPERHIEKQRRISEIYRKQPKREFCKACVAPLQGKRAFRKNDIDYFFCHECWHLNGEFEETDEFCKAVYIEGAEEYSENYKDETEDAFLDRVKKVYLPKASFFEEAIRNSGFDGDINCLDIGSAGGHFVCAMQTIGHNASGVDVGAEFGVHDYKQALQETKCNAVSMIGVLEHLPLPRAALESIDQNDSIELVLLSVPMFSQSTLYEILADGQFHRNLHGAHTHLFTTNSLFQLLGEYGLHPVGEWWFGCDAIDMMRMLDYKLRQTCEDEEAMDLALEMPDFVDDMQIVIDKYLSCSEVHLVLRKRHE